MTAHSTDINFACSQCGQRIVVDKSGAGQEADCPICGHPITVPGASGIDDGSHGAERQLSRDLQTLAPFADPGLEETREALFDASTEAGRLERELEMAHEDLARQQALIKKTTEECERQRASATHAHAELKSFQSDRQQLKADLAHMRQRVLSAENQIAELNAALLETARQRKQIENDLAVGRELQDATETQLAARERDLRRATDENSEIVQALAGTQAELAPALATAAGLRQDLEAARNDASRAGLLLVSSEQEIKETRARIEAAASENQQLRAEADAMQRDLRETASGRELLELRDRVQHLNIERDGLATKLAGTTTERDDLAGTAQTLRAELAESRRLCQDAERREEANSESQLKADNDILRGLNARNNLTLGAYGAELRRLRRARFALRILYVVFGLGLLGLAYFALTIFSSRGLDWIGQ